MDEMIADVVVVGYGGSGAVAAIEAHDAGASVIVLEKTEEGGGSTRESAGSLRLIVDLDKAENHFYALAMGTTPRPLLRTFAIGANEIPDWIRSHGGEIDVLPPNFEHVIFPYTGPESSFPAIPDSDGIGGRLRVKTDTDEGGGQALWRVLSQSVQNRSIKILYKSRAQKLVLNNAREIAGVLASGPAGEITVKARRAVVLTCGGFNYNAEMQRQFIGVELPALSPPNRNTGDGIKMAQQVGADLWHMNVVAAGFGFKVPGYEAAFYTKVHSAGFFIVDRKGQRYINETGVESHSGFLAQGIIDPVEGRHQRLPSYLIFDEEARKAGPIVTTSKRSYNQRFGWSKDNSDEIAKGWIKKGATLTELANQLDLPPQALEQTTHEYHDGYKKGTDLFGRPHNLMVPVSTPPYYGIALWPALLNTQGGPRRNEKAQIIDVFGDVIPRLYAAGELGSIWGALYPGAGNVCECLVYGRIAGRNAAAQAPIVV